MILHYLIFLTSYFTLIYGWLHYRHLWKINTKVHNVCISYKERKQNFMSSLNKHPVQPVMTPHKNTTFAGGHHQTQHTKDTMMDGRNETSVVTQHALTDTPSTNIIQTAVNTFILSQLCSAANTLIPSQPVFCCEYFDSLTAYVKRSPRSKQSSSTHTMCSLCFVTHPYTMSTHT